MSNRNPGFPNLDALRPAVGRGPLAQTRQYNQGEGVTEQAPRQDLRFNPRTLTPLQEVPRDQLNYVADTMRYCEFSHIALNVGVQAADAPVLSRPANKRTFLLIQNTHASQTMFVGFGVKPGVNIGVQIAAGGAALFDACVPQNDIWISGSGAATTGMLTYANQEFGQT